MSDHIYKLIEITGTSTTTMEDAINNGLNRAAQSVKNLRWFQVQEIRGDIEETHTRHWQVTLKIGFKIEDGE